ncbi:hypothetical protein MN116_001180 [Schistosoma mekongi]|uniref:Transcription factor 25 n=1 Tax=Schistosoma mekongi TaxID=38744 RepID=A0AAE1ZKT3_SCHME|nr:hypothetical protein MN116_001180 [Schistosoma mekongi]
MSSRVLRKLKKNSENLVDGSVNYSDSDDSIITGSVFSECTHFFPQVTSIPASDDSSHCHCESVKSIKRKKKKNKLKEKSEITDQLDNIKLTNDLETTDQNKQLVDLLKINTKALDHVEELGRLFGSDVIGASKTSLRGKRSRIKCGTLVTKKPTWPPTVRIGLSMESLGGGLYTFVHSKEYQNIQRSFYHALESMDLNNLSSILYKSPYHIDTLIQLSEIMMHQGDTTVGTDLLERALHAFESAFHPSFNPINGSCRLDFNRQVNRGLFIALFRYILTIGERGCYRSALEYCKLLLSLNYEDDPLTVLLMIDRYAIYSRRYDFLIDLYDCLNGSRNLYLLPNFGLSVPLARKLAGENPKKRNKSKMNVDEFLQDSLIMFPGFVTRLLKHTSIGGIRNLEKSVLFGKEVLISESDSLGCLLSLYVARMHPLWSSPNVLPWLEKNIQTVLNLVEPKQPHLNNNTIDPRLSEYSRRRKALYPAFPPKILRHLILSEVPEAPPVLPRNLTNSPIYTFDPLPPRSSINIYDPEEERRRIHAEMTGSGFLSGLLSSFIPSSSAQRVIAELVPPGPSDASIVNENASGSVSRIARAVAETFSATLRQVLERIDIRSVEIENEDTNRNQNNASDESS